MIKRLLPFILAPLLLAAALYLFGGLNDHTLAAEPPDWQTPLSDAQLEKAASKIDPELLADLRTMSTERLTVIVHIGGEADLAAAEVGMSRAERAALVVQQLQSFAVTAQTDVRTYLDDAARSGASVLYRPYFIFNGMAVTADADFFWHLALHKDVERLASNEQYTLTTADVAFVPGLDAPEGNISQINADDVWSTLGITGTGVVVANVDSGVQFDHPALLPSYLGNTTAGLNHDFAWYDATEIANPVPYDDNGHGTHTMGTAVGGDGPGPFVADIGVAPGASWIAVKAFSAAGTGTAADLHAAYEWIIAPCPVGVLPGSPSCDPAKAPDVVNNSWGNSNGASTEFETDIQALRAAGILPIFSAGNSGPAPGSVGSPASLAASFAVGAVDSSDVIAGFSSRGPSPLTNELKPDVSAPGVQIRSALPADSYGPLNGTSMAAPHVTGIAALMLSADPAIDLDTIERLIIETALDRGPAGPDEDYGHGRVDAFAAVQRVVNSGTIVGTITDSSDASPLAGAVISVSGNGFTSNQLSDGSGSYVADYLLAGSYTVTVDFYGYGADVLTDVIVMQDQTTTLDVALDQLPFYTVSGFVYDAVTTTIPISGALITALNTPLATVSTDVTGYYTISVAQGDVLFEAAAFGYATGLTDTTILTDTQVDFYLDPLPPILLVDDDEGALRTYSPHVEANYLQALDSNGYSYTYWDIERDGSPSFNVIRQYAAVVWFGGEFGRIKDISDAAQADAMMQYLDLGGRFFYVAQEHTFYYGDDADCDTPRWGGEGPCPFTEHYLGVADWIEDQKGDVLYGINGNPVGDGLGPYTLVYPPLLADFTDHITGTIQASLAFSVSDDVPVGDINLMGYTLFSPTAQFKTAFLASPLEALPEVDQADVMFSVMEWFGIAGLEEGATMAPAYQSQVAEAGQTITYSLRLRNLSQFTDSFDLDIATMPWPVQILDSTGSSVISEIGPLAFQETADFVVAVEIPAGTLAGAEATIEIQSTSQSGTPLTSSAFLTAQAKQVYYLLDSDQCDSGVHFDWVDATSGIQHQLNDDGTLPEFASEPLPSPFKFYNVAYNEVWFNDHGTVLFGNDNVYDDGIPSGTPAFPNPTLLDPNTAIYAAWGSFFWHPSNSPADWGVYTHHDVSRNWFVIQYHAYGNLLGEFDEFEIILDLNSNEIYLLYQTVTHSAFANVGLENQFGDEGVVYVIDEVPAQNILHDNLAVKFGIGSPPINREVNLSPAAQMGTGTPTSFVDYTVAVSSTSSVSDSFSLEVANSQWPVTFWDAGFNNQIAEIGPLDPCTSTEIGVRVELPTDTTYVSDTATIRARSQTDALVTGLATLTTDNAAPNVTTGPDQNGADFSRQTVTYTVAITNSGNITDAYDLTLSGNGWPAAVVAPAGSTSSLGPGASELVTVTVDIPAAASAGANDSVTLTAASQAYPGTSDATVLSTEALPFFAVAVEEPLQVGGGPPNWVAGYFVTVRNTGNISTTFNLEAIAYAWNTTLWNDSFTLQITETPLLAADETYRVGVRVTVPTTAIPPDLDMTLIRAQAAAALETVAFARLVTQVEPMPAGSDEITVNMRDPALDGDAGGEVTHFIQITNESGSARSYDVSLSGIAWTTTYSGSEGVPIPAGATLEIEVIVSIPGGALPGQWDKVTVDVVATDDPDVAAQTQWLTYIDTTGSFEVPAGFELKYIYLPIVTQP